MKLRRYLNEGQSRDFTHAKEMFLKTVSAFKEAKDMDSSTVTLIADMVRYMGKFVEEHIQLKSSAELKDSKELLRKAMDKLDIAAEKFGDAKAEKKPKKDDFELPADEPMEDDDNDLTAEPDGDADDAAPIDLSNDAVDAAPAKKGSSDPW